MQQHDLVSQRLNFTCPPVSAPARFESDTPGGTLSQKRDQIVTAKPPIRNLAGLGVDPVQLEHPLCNIQSVCRSIHLGPPFLKWLCRNSTLAH
ncbi:hypothetical protein AWB81_08533 [Caballeronia arationis]|nr:hypothetical protein AWB81_08235 [Caballeronia arationis]SAL08039.1 hypothetical protein AWB81_08533 [Caballeronia arationis]